MRYILIDPYNRTNTEVVDPLLPDGGYARYRDILKCDTVGALDLVGIEPRAAVLFDDNGLQTQPEALWWIEGRIMAGRAMIVGVQGDAFASCALPLERMRTTGYVAMEAAALHWIIAYGSKLLNARLIEGRSCWGLFTDEYLDRERPGWSREANLIGKVSPARKVTKAAFAMLAEARKSEPEARLAYYVFEGYPEGNPPPYRGYVAQAVHWQHGIGSIVFGLPDEQQWMVRGQDMEGSG